MKVDILREKIKEKNIDLFISTKHAKYLSETDAAYALIVTENRNSLITTRMGYERAKKESPIENVMAFTKTEVPTRKDEKIQFGKFNEILESIIEKFQPQTIGFDSLNEKNIEMIRKKAKNQIKEEPDLVWNLRMKKTPEEIKKIKKSGKIASAGMKKAKELIKSNLTEQEIATEIEYKMRKEGSEGQAFDTIVASGKNSIHPHAKTSNRTVRNNDLTIVDLGARWKNYCSDMSRTFCPNPSQKQNEIIDLVKKAQEKALEKVKAGIEAKELDKTARDVFKEEGLEKYYLHSTGHGLGLDIHEPPKISQSSKKTLKENMVITIEPGIYIEDLGGCRFEDIVIVKKNTFERITSL